MTIYLHKGCFDGVTSAAVARWFLRQRGEHSAVVVPIDYDQAPEWLGRALEPGACVVDFLYHPSATHWWDHHVSPFRRPHWRDEYQRRRAVDVVWDPTAKSCAGLMVRAFGAASLDVPMYLRRAADWADQIDSASYPTPEDAVVRPSAARQIALSLRVDSSPAYHAELIDALSEGDVEGLLLRPLIAGTVAKALARYARGVERLESTARLDGNVVVYVVDGDDILSDRLVPFFLHRAADYSLGIVRNGAQVKVTANANPWRPPSGPNLGQIFAEHGGGGHHDVGSVILKGSDAIHPENVMHDVLEALQS